MTGSSRAGIEMELKDIVEEGVVLDVDRFKALTAPNRAATGLGYARLMVRLLDWRDGCRGLGERAVGRREARGPRLHASFSFSRSPGS